MFIGNTSFVVIVIAAVNNLITVFQNFTIQYIFKIMISL